VAGKRPKLTGIERLFEPSALAPAAPPSEEPAVRGEDRIPDRNRWEDRYHRRTFYCADQLWEALDHWCQQTRTSHSAALNAAIQTFLDQQPRRPD